ncbi:MAG: VapC toxin family PIN domain ribonuclease [Candidatus Latescibacteria bacterium]|nr:VapC toxin family PIN domain ribonuclease [Candidatus Latescibacterota bacterium]
MVLVDTPIWVSFLRSGNGKLKALLREAKVACHPLIVGELACGKLANRMEFLTLLQTLPQAFTASQREVLHFIDHHRLSAAGIGLIDAHLMASARLSDLPLWTSEGRLRAAAVRLEIAYLY